jgi:hypothetical protein
MNPLEETRSTHSAVDKPSVNSSTRMLTVTSAPPGTFAGMRVRRTPRHPAVIASPSAPPSNASGRLSSREQPDGRGAGRAQSQTERGPPDTIVQ